ncbi:hypothetical protein BV22DRAFT_1024249 [Leucogyrophana mollusca]|uniref:Uncharacterized protein n=1 Tax=Leucogyrophana mollusca TaxID=85980 RepID=A0ACB8B076_9AGAM|nr:hypothetical protein BV22DRAFT_1024249 [Leucogyrophana mollusca]
MFNAAPTLAPGGGAEALPAGLLDGPDSLASSWFVNNGFAPFNNSTFSRQHSNHPPSSSSRTLDCTNHYSPHFQSSSSYSPPGASANLKTSYNPFLPPADPSPVAPPLQAPPSAKDLLTLTSNGGLSAPSPLGLPVYSSSGFDLLSVLARVASRPHPGIVLGPVDGSCSFAVADVRRYDSPIIYASPLFYRLTGYDEHEVLGRNCRFLQSPDGNVQKGEVRRGVAPEAVAYMKKSLLADKECQMSLINYRKGGQAFVNLVTVIPIRGGVYNRPEEADDVVYHVGFQVDLTEQPNAILQKLRDGSYIVNYSATSSIPSMLSMPRDRRINSPPSSVLSKELKSLIADTKFTSSVPLSTAANVVSNTPLNVDKDAYEGNQLLNMLLLEKSPDFVLVLSLKGAFLYVAPSVRLVLGYESEELVGKSVSDYCHPADLVPLMRELKESSASPGAGPDVPSTQQPLTGSPKTVDLLFRAQSKSRGYVWIECRGRLHVEPGKGRKAIILSGRAKTMPSLGWGAVAGAGGVGLSGNGNGGEFWGMLSAKGTFLVVGAGVREMLGWGVGEVVGMTVGNLVVGPARKQVEEALMRRPDTGETSTLAVSCEMRRKDGIPVPVRFVLYRNSPELGSCPLVCQIKPAAMGKKAIMHDLATDVFDELDTARGTSWQYELQQLKFANQRLMEEVDALEVTPLPPPGSQRCAAPPRRGDEVQDWANLMGGHSGHLKRSWGSENAPT